MNRLRMVAVALAVLTLGTSFATSQTWQPLTNPPSFSPGAVLLLTDGTVLAHSEPNCLNRTSTDYNSWYKLTPDSSGSYVNGTWTQVASPTGYAPLYFGSVVLPDGRVVVVTRFQNPPASCFAILQYRSIASASCCFSMYSPSVCAT